MGYKWPWGQKWESPLRQKCLIPIYSALNFMGPSFIQDTLHHLWIVRLCFIRKWLGIYVNLDSGQILEAKC